MKKKILFYSECYIFGGCENVLVNLILSPVVNERFDVLYAYARNRDYQRGVDSRFGAFPKKYPLRILSNGNLFYRIDGSGMNKYLAFLIKAPLALLQRMGVYALYNFLRLSLFIREQKPDILHINNGGYPSALSCRTAVFSAKLAGVPRIVFNVNNLAQKQKGVIDRLVDWYVHKHVDYFITASQAARSNLIKNRGFDAGKIVQIFNAQKPNPVRKTREEVLGEYGVASDKFVIVTVAYLTERKGHLFLLEALDSIRRTDADLYDNLVLFLVGDGEMRPEIESYIREHGLDGKVILTGFRNDDYHFINAADLFILPSLRDEDMPYVILSAMELSKPVISTKVAGIVEEIRDGIDGVLLDPAELHRLPALIKELHSDSSLRSSYGASARNRYQASFALDKILRKYLDVYKRLYPDDTAIPSACSTAGPGQA
ncbi:MAG TPA: glycosyltransferase [Nitrospirota bacterium]|nr:glycosyltransferase [Nitrospirota bacterium]